MSNHDPLDIRGQDKAKADRSIRDKLARDTEESDLKWLMSSKRGRRIIWRQLDRAGVFRLSFNTNAMQMAFAEGNRNEGLRTLAAIQTHCPELYLVMVKEQTNEQRNADDGHGHNDH
ncbi:MAG: endopeptidase [Hyphomicrobiaceae bacterium]|nr:MAG: endopeptidase [Hyphomicrobiaceae bacterium]